MNINLLLLYTYFFADIQEKTISQLHDIGFVYGGNLSAVVFSSIIKSKFGNTLTLGSGHNLETFDDAGNRFVLQTRVFSFSLLSDNHKVKLFAVTGLNTFQTL